MNFYKMLDIIQSKNEGRIVLCDLGCFYITSGSNALLCQKGRSCLTQPRIKNIVI